MYFGDWGQKREGHRVEKLGHKVLKTISYNFVGQIDMT